MEEYPSNSHTTRPPNKKLEPKQIKKVTDGEVIRRKRPLGTRLKETFFGGDSRGVWGYVTKDVIVPSIKDLIADATHQAVERMVFGEARGPGRYRPGGGPVSYNRYATTRPAAPPWSASAQQPQRDLSPRARATHGFDEIILQTRGAAEEAIDQLIEIVSTYGSASVADLYAMVGISSAYTDQKYGWTNLQGANVQHMRGGTYLLNLPKPEPLD